MKYPTGTEVEDADREKVCRWHRFLPLARTGDELVVSNQIFDRFVEFGGFTPEISKRVGWDQ